MEAMRAEVGGLRKQHAELTGLVHQWYNSVMQLQQQQAAAAMAARGRRAVGILFPTPREPGGVWRLPRLSRLSAGRARATAPQPAPAQWSEHYTAEGHKYWYNITTGQSSWTGHKATAVLCGGPKAKGRRAPTSLWCARCAAASTTSSTTTTCGRPLSGSGRLCAPRSPSTRTPANLKGFGFVSFDSAEAADAAIAR